MFGGVDAILPRLSSQDPIVAAVLLSRRVGNQAIRRQPLQESHMAEPFLSEIRMMSFGFAPKGWALCNGQLLPINQNQALFSLLGTTFGGDGRVNFALPNLQGNVPIHVGQGHTLGERGGQSAHTLNITEIPTHVHQMQATNATATQPSPASDYLAATGTSIGAIYSSNAPQFSGALNPAAVGRTGGSQAHLNMQPFLTLNFSIALQGIFPSQT